MTSLETVRAVLATTALLCSFATAATITGRVVSVADGDTITVLDEGRQQHKIRLDGIDAPENAQPFGRRSKQSLAEMVAGEVVNVETHKQDRYGRSVGKVIHKGRDVNLEQVRSGMAWHYKAYEREQAPEDRASYARAEAEAQDARAGLWSQPTRMAPWEFRKQGKSKPGSSLAIQ